MANLYPPIEKIRELQIPKEEMELINILSLNLDDSYNLYYKPFLNGDTPDIIVMKKNSGVFILETSDLDLSSCSYIRYDKEKKYSLGQFYKNDELIVYNPLQHIYNCKQNIFGMHIEQLYMEKKRNPQIFNELVKLGVLFYKSNNEIVNKTFQNCLYNVKIWGMNSNLYILEYIKNILDKNCKYMNNELYKNFHNLLKPLYHFYSDGQYYKFTNKQKELIKSVPNSRTKIRGVAGCGKTLVLVNRAVSVVEQNRGKVLILTYNITLKNYIKTRLQKVAKDFSWDSFVITHYHDFINNYNLKNHRYAAILIDEGQDFKKDWLDKVKTYLAENGEFVIFADEKQTIYKNNELDDNKKTTTNIIGRWNELNKSFRINNEIYKLAIEFQKYFFFNKYDLDYLTKKQILSQEEQDIHYEFSTDITYSQIFDKVYNYIKKYSIPQNDVCILGNEIESLREMEYYARKKYNITFEKTFETIEEYNEISKMLNPDKELYNFRKIRKSHFYIDCGKIKISTTHSFKGWEIETLVLIIDEKHLNTTAELIYTALTRCKDNLLIFNKGNIEFDNFFSKNIR